MYKCGKLCHTPFIDSSMNSWISSTLKESIDCANINSCKQTNKQTNKQNKTNKQTNKQNKTKQNKEWAINSKWQLCTLHLMSLSRKLTWRLTPLISLNDDSSSSLLVWNGSLTSDCEESQFISWFINPIPIQQTTTKLNYHRLQSGSSCFHNTLAQ